MLDKRFDALEKKVDEGFDASRARDEELRDLRHSFKIHHVDQRQPHRDDRELVNRVAVALNSESERWSVPPLVGVRFRVQVEREAQTSGLPAAIDLRSAD